MSILSKLFGGGGGSPAKPQAEPEHHKGFRIYPVPAKEPGGYRVAARIEKEVDGVVRSHRLVRADICDTETTAAEIAVRKAKSLIDERGESLLDA